MQTAKDEENLISSTIIQCYHSNRMFSKSNFKFLFVNREEVGQENFESEQERYNRLLGFDYNFISKND